MYAQTVIAHSWWYRQLAEAGGYLLKGKLACLQLYHGDINIIHSSLMKSRDYTPTDMSNPLK